MPPNDNFNKYNLGKRHKLKLLSDSNYQVPKHGTIEWVSNFAYKVVVYKNEYEHNPANIDLVCLEQYDDGWREQNKERFCVEYINGYNGRQFISKKEVYVGNLLIKLEYAADDWRGADNARIMESSITRLEKNRPFPLHPYLSIELVGSYAVDLNLGFPLDKLVKSSIMNENEIMRELKGYTKKQYGMLQNEV